MIIDEEYLEHFGKKGMKWGVRRQRRLDQMNRVAKGKGSRGDKVREALSISTSDLAKGRGLRGGVAVKAARVTARRDRIRSGKATAGDVLAHVGTTRLIDLGPLDR